MPTVPTVDAPTVSQSGAPLSISPPPDAFGANVAGEALGKLGATAQSASDMLAQHAERFQAINNKAESDKAFSNFVPAAATLWENYKTANQGDLAAANLPEFYTRLDKLRTDVGGAMSNPMSKEMYDSQSHQEFRSLTNQGASYAAAQTQKFATDQHVAAQDARITSIANDLTTYGANKEALVLNQALWDHFHGVSSEAGQLNVQKLLSKAVGDVTGILANSGKPEEADAFFQAHRGDMTGDAQRQVEAALRPLLQANLARTVADEYVNHAANAGGPANSVTAPAGIDALVQQGAVITSGLRTPEHNAAVGGMPNSHHLTDTARDLVPPKGMTLAQLGNAARAAVPGAKVIVEKDHVHVQWDGSPASGPLARVDNIEANAANTYAAIANDPRLHGNPVLIHQAQSEFINNVNQERAVTNLGSSAAKERLIASAQAAGVTSVGGLAKLPGAADDLRQLSPTAQRTLDHQLTAQGNVWDPVKTARYNELVGLRELHPEQFLATDMSKEALPLSAIRGLATDQSKIMKKQQTVLATSANLQRALGNEFVKQGVASAQLKPDTPDYNHFTGALYAELENWGENHPGKKPNDMELGQMASGVLAKRTVPATWLFGKTTMEQPGYAVPEGNAKELSAQFKSHYGRDPTDAEVAYFYHKAGGK